MGDGVMGPRPQCPWRWLRGPGPFGPYSTTHMNVSNERSWRLFVYICVQAGETSLHVAVRHCHFNVADKILRFLTKKQSRYDLVMLVNEQNEVSTPQN